MLQKCPREHCSASFPRPVRRRVIAQACFAHLFATPAARRGRTLSAFRVHFRLIGIRLRRPHKSPPSGILLGRSREGCCWFSATERKPPLENGGARNAAGIGRVEAPARAVTNARGGLRSAPPAPPRARRLAKASAPRQQRAPRPKRGHGPPPGNADARQRPEGMQGDGARNGGTTPGQVRPASARNALPPDTRPKDCGNPVPGGDLPAQGAQRCEERPRP